MSNIAELANTPELSFIENMSLQETEEQLRAHYIRLYRELTGKEPELGDADIKNLLIKAFSLMEYQTMQYIDAKGRAEVLKTSTGDALDALAALVGLSRKEPEKATATQRFTLSETLESVTAIPEGTRVKTPGGKYFSTAQYAEIPAGERYADVVIQAEEAGADSSGISAGGISVLVDPIPYVESVTNITATTGGLDTEDDDSLTRRIYLAPSVYSCAGPREAYEYLVREWRSDVADVQIVSPAPCEVNVYFVMEDETGLRLPNETEMELLREHLSADSVRPLCDQVICLAPEEVEYAIEVTYWIAQSDQRNASEIQSKVETALADFQTWQRKLNRDVNPTELIARLREAGVKRVKLTAPEDITITNTQLPKCASVLVTYGGLEDD